MPPSPPPPRRPTEPPSGAWGYAAASLLEGKPEPRGRHAGKIGVKDALFASNGGGGRVGCFSPPQPVADPAHGEGGDHAADGEHGHGEGPEHGEDVRGGGRVLGGCKHPLGAAPSPRARDGAGHGAGDGAGDGAVLPGGVGGQPVHGDDAQHARIVGFYHLQRGKSLSAHIYTPSRLCFGVFSTREGERPGAPRAPDPAARLGAYLLGRVDDAQAVAVLEEAQHRGEDGEDQRSRQVLPREQRTASAPALPQDPRVSPRGRAARLPMTRGRSPGGRQDAVLPCIEQPEPTALLVPGGFVGPAAGRGTAALLEQSSSKKKKKKTAKILFFSNPVPNIFSLHRG